LALRWIEKGAMLGARVRTRQQEVPMGASEMPMARAAETAISSQIGPQAAWALREQLLIR
jgi:hypothetical protein